MSPASPIRVGSIPAGHPYVAHLAAPGDLRVFRPADPTPAVTDPLPGQWWPPVLLEAEWVSRHADEIDLMHLHFGFDASSPDELRRWVDTLDRHRRPLVLTMHDLVNPHFADQRDHLARLDVLVPRAAAVITLTDAAAAEIDRRWHRRATVISHPHVVSLDRIARPAAPHPDGFLIGLHAKDLRANIDPLPIVTQIAAALPDLPGARLRVDLHPGVLTAADDRSRALVDWLDRVVDRGDIEVAVHRRFSDAQLYDYLQSLDLCVLPYAFGTHSGWLEACVDLGTAAIVPQTGCFSDQHGHPAYRHPSAADVANPAAKGGGRGDLPLAEVLAGAFSEPGSARPPRPDRAAQRRRIGDAHVEVYRGALREFSPTVG